MNRYFSGESAGLIAVVLAATIWASSFIALKIALDSVGPMSIIFGRMIVASLIFAIFIPKFLKIKFSKNDVLLIGLMVLFEPSFYFIFEIKALQFTSASQAGVITATLPLLVAIGAGIVLKEAITKRLIFGSVLALSGAIWLSIEASVETYAPNPLLGNFLEFIAMICAAGYTITLKFLTKKISALFLTAIQAFAGAIFYLPLAFWESWGRSLNYSSDGIFAIFYLGIIVTLGGYGLYNFALTKLPASKTSAFMNLIPAIALILGFIILNERLSFYQLLATGLIFLGVIITQSRSRKIR